MSIKFKRYVRTCLLRSGPDADRGDVPPAGAPRASCSSRRRWKLPCVPSGPDQRSHLIFITWLLLLEDKKKLTKIRGWRNLLEIHDDLFEPVMFFLPLPNVGMGFPHVPIGPLQHSHHTLNGAIEMVQKNEVTPRKRLNPPIYTQRLLIHGRRCFGPKVASKWRVLFNCSRSIRAWN